MFYDLSLQFWRLRKFFQDGWRKWAPVCNFGLGKRAASNVEWAGREIEHQFLAMPTSRPELYSCSQDVLLLCQWGQQCARARQAWSARIGDMTNEVWRQTNHLNTKCMCVCVRTYAQLAVIMSNFLCTCFVFFVICLKKKDFLCCPNSIWFQLKTCGHTTSLLVRVL